jgi:hypothetical protein
MRLQQFLGKNSRELTTTCFAGTLSAFGQEGNIFSICYSTGEFLLHFMKVIQTTKLIVEIYATWLKVAKATFTNCYPCKDATCCGPVGCLCGKQGDVHSVFVYIV